MLDAELTIVGPRGPIRSGAGRTGSGAIVVLDVRHTLVSPRDPATGQAAGRRQHAPIVVTKHVDRATPQLADAWARNEVLTTWRLDAFGTDTFGRRQPRFSVELRRVVVVEISLTTPESSSFPREAVAFGYERITWTWHDGNITAADDWLTPT